MVDFEPGLCLENKNLPVKKPSIQLPFILETRKEVIMYTDDELFFLAGCDSDPSQWKAQQKCFFENGDVEGIQKLFEAGEISEELLARMLQSIKLGSVTWIKASYEMWCEPDWEDGS